MMLYCYRQTSESGGVAEQHRVGQTAHPASQRPGLAGRPPTRKCQTRQGKQNTKLSLPIVEIKWHWLKQMWHSAFFLFFLA